MIKVGLTGGIACGKTTVGEMFVRRGAHLIQADHIAHQLMSPGQPVYEAVVQRFGREIVQPEGTINRKALAAIAFGQNRVEELNALVHPPVIRRQEEWMEEIGRADADAVAIVEAALIFEAGVGKRFDKIVVVTCAAEQKIERFARRLLAREPHWSEQDARAEAERRVKAQMPDEEKARRADYVIDNSGPLAETEQAVERVWQQLRSGSEHHSRGESRA